VKRNLFLLGLLILLAAGAASYVMTLVESPAGAPIAQPVPPPATTSTVVAQATADNIKPATTEAPAREPLNPFAVRNWEPPKPKVEPAPPPPPQAPPLPFRFIGKVQDGDTGTAFMLQHGERIVAVKEGDEIDGTYKVEGYRNGQLEFLYRPLQIRQSLFVGYDS